MNEYPMSISELESQFNTEEACQQYLISLRWPDGYICPRCGNKKGWEVRTLIFECSECHCQTSVTAGTIFHGTRKPLTMWFRAIWWITAQKNGSSALGLQRILGLKSYQTSWTWLHKLRHAMIRPGREKLTGDVEVDEAYIGAEESGKTGRGATKKSLVAVAVEVNNKKMRRVRIRRINDASSSSLHEFILESVERGSCIHTDGWIGYNGLEALGYTQKITKAKDIEPEKLLPRVHIVISLLKRWILGTLQGSISKKHIDFYLDEFTFRFNRRTSAHRGKLFYRLLQNAMQIETITYNELVGKNASKP